MRSTRRMVSPMRAVLLATLTIVTSAFFREREPGPATSLGPAVLQYSFQLPAPLATLVKDDAFSKWINPNSASAPVFFTEVIPNWKRKCQGSVRCYLWDFLGGRETWVKIEPVKDSPQFDIDNLGYGGVIARITFIPKLAEYGERHYGLPLSDDTFYVIVEPPAPGGKPHVGRWSIVQVTGNSSHILDKHGDFIYCDLNAPAAKNPYAGFRGCQTRHPPIDAAISRVIAAPSAESRSRAKQEAAELLLGDSETDDPGWTSCIHGCCVAE